MQQVRDGVQLEASETHEIYNSILKMELRAVKAKLVKPSANPPTRKMGCAAYEPIARILFEAWDRDNDGNVSFTEVPGEFILGMIEADADGSLTMELDEFLEYVAAMRQEKGDGWVDAELIKLQHDLSMLNPSQEAIVTQLFKALDVDMNGHIDLDECPTLLSDVLPKRAQFGRWSDAGDGSRGARVWELEEFKRYFADFKFVHGDQALYMLVQRLRCSHEITPEGTEDGISEQILDDLLTHHPMPPAPSLHSEGFSSPGCSPLSLPASAILPNISHQLASSTEIEAADVDAWRMFAQIVPVQSAERVKPSQQSTARAMKKFNKFDADANGTLSGQELAAAAEWIWTMYHPLGEKMSAKALEEAGLLLLEQLDVNKDGVIDYEEFCGWFAERQAAIEGFRRVFAGNVGSAKQQQSFCHIADPLDRSFECYYANRVCSAY